MEELNDEILKGAARVNQCEREVKYAKHQFEVVNEKASQNLATTGDQRFAAKYLRDAEHNLKSANTQLTSATRTLIIGESDEF